MNRRTPPSNAEVCLTVFFLFVVIVVCKEKKNRPDRKNQCLNAERQEVGVELKYTSVLFTAWLLYTAP